MGREGNDPCIGINSSIALLQERFRVLQKEKERREERQLMNKFLNERLTLTSSSSPALQFQHQPVSKQRLFFNPDLMLPQKQNQKQKHPQIFLSLWPSSNICYQEHNRVFLLDKDANPLLQNLWPKDMKPSDRPASVNNNSLSLDNCCMDCDSDVDTSLHL